MCAFLYLINQFAASYISDLTQINSSFLESKSKVFVSFYCNNLFDKITVASSDFEVPCERSPISQQVFRGGSYSSARSKIKIQKFVFANLNLNTCLFHVCAYSRWKYTVYLFTRFCKCTKRICFSVVYEIT